MNSNTGSKRQFADRLRQFLRAAEAGALDLPGRSALFVVGLDKLPPEEAESWLRKVIRDKGRILISEDAGIKTAASTQAPSKPGPAGVSPEEKSILWGK